jgi:hypothetical protein
VLIATGSASVYRTATLRIRLHLTRAGRQLLEQHARRLRLSAHGSFTLSGQAPVATSRPFTLNL